MPLASLLVLLSCVAAGPSVRVELLEGAPLEGILQACSAEGVVVEVGGTAQKIPVDKVLQLEILRDHSPFGLGISPQLELIDGSRFAIKDVTITQGEGAVTLREGQKLSIRSRAMKWMRLKPVDPALEKNWTDLLASKVESDLLIIRKKNEQGTEFLDAIDGVVEGISEEKVSFVFSGETTNVPRAKVEGIVFFQPPGRELADQLGQIQEEGGAKWSARSLELKGDNVEFTTVAGPRHVRSIAEIAKIDFSTGKLLRLVDLTPETDDWKPALGAIELTPELKRHREYYAKLMNRVYTAAFVPKLAGGGGLDAQSTAGAPLVDGLALLSGSSKIYSLPGKYRRFTVTVVAGIPQGDSAQLRILGDTKVLYEGDITGGQAPLPLDLDVTNVRRIKVYVVDRRSFDQNSLIYLCRPRIWK